jgi:phosphoribosyl 1,2-cyclic phosphate phosphodiesterase
MRVTMLGCGASTGVPLITGDWGTCDPKDPRNRRRRSSILLEKDGFRLLVDAGPDARTQLVDAGVRMVDAILLTHAHADHTHGLDEIRPYTWADGRRIPVHGDAASLAEVRRRFDYLFEKSEASPTYFRIPMEAVEIDVEPFTIGPFAIEPSWQDHGASGRSLGFVFDRRLAYSTDLHSLAAEDIARLQGIPVWIVDCLRETPTSAHATLEDVMGWVERVRPGRTYLTHMNHMMDYRTILAKCPEGVEPGHDGLVIDL